VTLPVVIAVGLMGGIGALARSFLDGAVAERAGRELPWGTLVVNLLGALVLGTLVGAELDGNELQVAGTGFVGAFTTFSTWAFESHRLGEDGRLGLGVANFVVSLALGVAAALAGRALGGLL
jgi:CrcB protein